MIDVMFFLLATFMLASLTMQNLNSLRVDLPRGTAERMRATHPITMTVTREGRIYLDQSEVTQDTLVARLKPMLSLCPIGRSPYRPTHWRQTAWSCTACCSRAKRARSASSSQSSMSEEAGLRPPFDRPWRRLPLELVLAAALGALMLAAFVSVLGRSARQADAPSPIEAQLVVIPPEPKPVPVPKPPPKRVESVERPGPPPVVRKPPVRRVHRPAPEPKVATPAQPPTEPTPARPAPHEEVAVPSAIAPALPAGSLAPERMTARAILRPVPQIPDALRRHAFETLAVVRFAAAADGSAKATLVQATPLPQLNVLLLEAFNRWWFFPALQAGKPVASVVELRVPVKVQ